MNGKERVLTALNHEKTDRVPLDLGGRQTTMTLNAAKRYKEHYGITTPTEVMSERWQTAYIDEEILQKYQIDTRHIRPPSRVNENLLQKGLPVFDGDIFYDEWHVGRQVANEYANIVKHPLQQASMADLDAFDWPIHPELDYDCTGLREHAKQLYDEGQYALVGCQGNACNVFEQSWYLRGLSEFFMDMAADQDFAHALLRRVCDIRKQNMKAFLTEVGEYIDIFQFADDLASQGSTLMSPDMYKELIKPYHIELIQYAQQFTKAKIFYHSCGAVMPLIDELIDNGIDILNPVQVSAENMDTSVLKKRFGNRVNFWGAIDTFEILPHGSKEDVKKEVQKRIYDLSVSGGYVLGPVHNIQSDVSPENIDIMYKTALITPTR